MYRKIPIAEKSETGCCFSSVSDTSPATSSFFDETSSHVTWRAAALTSVSAVRGASTAGGAIMDWFDSVWRTCSVHLPFLRDKQTPQSEGFLYRLVGTPLR